MRRALLALGCAVGFGCDAPARAQGSGSAALAPAPAPVAAPGGADDATAPVTLPKAWLPLAAVAEAGLVAADHGNAAHPTVVRTWGDAGLGCFVTVVDITGTRAEQVAELAAELETTLRAAVDVEGWAFTDGAVAEVTATIVRGTMRGALRARLIAEPTGVPHAAVASCFYNDREPVRCQAACTTVLSSLEAPKVTP